MSASLCYDAPPLPPNTYMHTYNRTAPFSKGQYVWIYCGVGFLLSNTSHQFLHCKGKNEWSIKTPACIKHKCVLPKQPSQVIVETNEKGRFASAPHIDIISTQYSRYSQLKFSCSSNLKLKGRVILTCRRDFQWDFYIPKCVREQDLEGCMLPQQPHILSLHYRPPGREAYRSIFIVHRQDVYFNYGASLIFACKDPGTHDLDSKENSIHCTAKGWNINVPKCLPKRLKSCTLPRQSPGVIVEIRYPETNDNETPDVVYQGPTLFKPGTRVFISCPSADKYTLICNNDGTWNQDIPSCGETQLGKPCTLPKQGSEFRISVQRLNEDSFTPDGIPHTAKTEYYAGEQIQFGCKSETKEIEGAIVLTCLDNQQFDHKPPRCVNAVKPDEPDTGCVISKQSKRGLRVFARFPGKPKVMFEMNELTSRNYVFPPEAVLNFSCINKLDEIYSNGHRWARCLSNNRLNISRLPECIVACGITHKHPETRIKYGGFALEYAWPWIGSYGLNYYTRRVWHHFCGGSIISDTWFLTASHCLTKANTSREMKSAERSAVMFGSNSIVDQDWDENAVQIRKAKRLILHDNFDWGPHPGSWMEFDIALIELQEPVTFTEYVTPVCLNNPDESYNPPTLQQNDEGMMYGWGLTEERVNPTYLLEAQGLVEFCTTYINYRLKIAVTNTFCVKNYTLFSMVQGGDSGGPFTTQSRKRHYQRGVISNFGVEVSGMTYVDPYVPWIKGVVGRRLAVHQND